MRLKILEILQPELDAIFDEFYHKLLSHPTFSAYFPDPTKIKPLIEKQKAYFKQSFEFDDETLKAKYIALGEMHYDIKLPFVDFSSGIDILQEKTIHAVYRSHQSEHILDATFVFFRLIRAYTAKGYLNKILAQDAEDIDIYLEKVAESKEAQNAIAIDRLLWLKNFIFAIQKENKALAPSFYIEPEIIANIQNSLRQKESFMSYIHEMVSRIRIDASNVFFFLEKKDYSDVLPLYRELLSIYKLSLMLTNVITIANNDAIITDLSKDPLTKLLNRSTMHSLIEKEFAIADSQDYDVSLIFMDIDHFKLINDQYGHECGDMVLAQVAKIVKNSIRATDFAFRYGGEEILILLKAAPERVALRQAEQIRKEIEQHDFCFHENLHLDVTASFGIKTCKKPFVLTVEEAIFAADEMMYRAKGMGRNRVFSAIRKSN
jgi:diguanylate cyclase (GGDEF)-like protein